MRRWILCLITISGWKAAGAQFYYYNHHYYDQKVILEAGVQTGYINCLTDLGGNKGPGKGFIKDLQFNTGSINAGMLTAVNLNRKVVLKIGFIKGKIGAADSLADQSTDEGKLRFNRNLHFQSPISEISVHTELHVLNILNKKENSLNISPYLDFGAGIFSFCPKALFNGTWYKLPDYRTEGQGLSTNTPSLYKLTQFNLPMGAGILIEAGAKWNIRMEIIHRKLFTDYLDDVSGRYPGAELFHLYFEKEQANIAEVLSDRRRVKNDNAAGQIRGGKGNDGYFTGNILLTYVLNRKPVH